MTIRLAPGGTKLFSNAYAGRLRWAFEGIVVPALTILLV